MCQYSRKSSLYHSAMLRSTTEANSVSKIIHTYNGGSLYYYYPTLIDLLLRRVQENLSPMACMRKFGIPELSKKSRHR